MKITKLELLHVKPRWLLLKMHTDEGIIGYGEPTLEGRSRSVEMFIKECEDYLLGQDPRYIEHHCQVLYRGGFYRGGPVQMSAISGIEQAMWDIKGKFYNMPVYEMLGGACRTKIRMYSHIKKTAIAGGNSVDEMVAMALARRSAGYTAVKYSIIPPIAPIDTLHAVREAVNRFAAVREAIGEQMDLAIDFHGRVSPAMAIRLAAELEPYYPMFIEEPCLPENVDAMVNIARSTRVPIAAGERLFSKWGFRELIEKQAVAIVQPDTCHAGGIFEGRKIASMAEMYYMTIAPHNPLGPVSLAACLQLDACTPNFLIQEHPGADDLSDLGVGYLKTPFEVIDGYIDVPKGPGLGIELDEEAIRGKLFDGSWETPLIYHEDGSLADW
ncbi:galactonate dehydratase [Paenibacillus thalictri]|uniref:Galactonate dehydratase n=1 Tax=Paenibacillus thalictri TaxID=2527873 RepID=A0A4Q9DM71_9BACL|nr:galactonate dehydratase [Paenibacillus thalictri]TBL74570.1 galactonate dehydratase [Paenibacillus thalictri]